MVNWPNSDNWGPGAVGWPRPSIPGPYIWLKADTLLPTYANGDPVSLWNDISGTENLTGDHADAVAAGSARPTFLTGVLNGHSVVEFDGVNDGMRISALFGDWRLQGNIAGTVPHGVDLEWDAFVVFKPSGGVSGVLFDSDDQTNQPGTVRASDYLFLENPDLVAAPASAFRVNALATLSAGNWYIGETWTTATQAQALVDGVGGSIASFTAHLESANGYWVGKHGSVSAYFNGQIAEIIGYDWKLSPGERAYVMGYLQSVYGL